MKEKKRKEKKNENEGKTLREFLKKDLGSDWGERISTNKYSHD